MLKNPLKSLTLSCVVFTICLLHFSHSGVVKSSLISDNTKDDFERDARVETENFLNTIFTSQIEFFNKFKTSLKPDSRRYQDIEKFVVQLESAKEEKELEKKDVMYWESFKEFKQSPLLVNEESETGMNDTEFTNALNDYGFKDMLKNFFADVAVYFWKMAKVSGKVVETTIDEYIEEMQKSKSLI